MSRRLLANENFPGPAIRKLRDAGIDVVAVVEAMPAASDTTVLAGNGERGLKRRSGRRMARSSNDALPGNGK